METFICHCDLVFPSWILRTTSIAKSDANANEHASNSGTQALPQVFCVHFHNARKADVLGVGAGDCVGADEASAGAGLGEPLLDRRRDEFSWFSAASSS
jgi:hypothetical protein